MYKKTDGFCLSAFHPPSSAPLFVSFVYFVVY